MRIIPLSEGSFTVDASKKFIPFNSSEDETTARSKGSLLVEIQPFAIVTGKDVIILDTGLGLRDESGQLQLFKNLLNAGIKPAAVTKVLITHLHKDHCGGLINPFTNTPGFENARYYMQQREIDFAREQGAPSYNTEVPDIIINSEQLVTLKEDKGEIDGYIHYEVTGAHSKFHQVFWIKDENEVAFFGADDAPQLYQMKHRFAAKYDYDGKKAMQLRGHWWKRGRQEGWKFLFYHDIKTPVFHNEPVIN